MDNKVFLAGCRTYEQGEVDLSVSRCLEFFGGAKALLGSGKRVLLKPNLLMARAPDTATTTHPSVISAVAREFIKAGAEVIIADSPGGPYTTPLLTSVYKACGMAKVAEETGASLNFDTSSRDVRCERGETVKSFPIINPLLDADLIISCSKIKTHGLAYYSGAVKNMFGAIPGLTKPVFHARYPNIEDFCSMLVDLCELVRPALSIADGVVGMEGDGPSGGKAREIGVIASSMSPHALDLACMDIAGLDPEKSGTFKNGVKRSLVPASPSLLDCHGDDAGLFRTKLMPSMSGKKGANIRILPKFMQPPLKKLLVPYPKIEDTKCIGCAKCAESCPQKIIAITDNKARINYKDCIKCFCCHEMCPVRAISFSRSVK